MTELYKEPFSFWYSGLTLNDATLLVSDTKLGENKQKRVETAVKTQVSLQILYSIFSLKCAIFVQTTFSGGPV